MNGAAIVLDGPAATYNPLEMKRARAERVTKLLKDFVATKGETFRDDEIKDWMADLLADMLHTAELRSINQVEMIRLALSHYESEVHDDHDVLAARMVQSDASPTAH